MTRIIADMSVSPDGYAAGPDPESGLCLGLGLGPHDDRARHSAPEAVASESGKDRDTSGLRRPAVIR
ncbi:conserved hypothetical protein [Streptomyces sviceus ATCC 29083]|uniref:Uncharacterized protein n=1 Tax=Streptomyces sviceus (strain ATCC 29083 / DSM 924 / JCM 4929 / NBRC 13980 / NCIMB 11184 / NRRL 5439 / UC 5370) TaxID=463191 RepID=B5HP48_STRX2|nr:conserved hypothetical protein [Streptomyces sviceus ATCC 29083]